MKSADSRDRDRLIMGKINTFVTSDLIIKNYGLKTFYDYSHIKSVYSYRRVISELTQIACTDNEGEKKKTELKTRKIFSAISDNISRLH